MSIKNTRTTVALDNDVVIRVKQQNRAQGASFRDTLNDLLRLGLLQRENHTHQRKLHIKPAHMGYRPGLNHDSVESLLENGEGERHR